jgi:DNA-binding MarR family transcriptional regulator
VDRDAALDAIVRALRKIDFQGEVFGQTVAVRLGLSESDIKALELLVDSDPVTAGRLAEMLNLSTGAVTRVLDRLEQAGYVRRTADAADRRRVVVEVVSERMTAIRDALGPLGDAQADVVAGYTDDQLDLINDFLSKMADAGQARADAARETLVGLPEEGVHRAPLGALQEARLLVRSGATDLVLNGAAGATDLYRARFDGKQPMVRVRDGTVIVAYRDGMREIFDWRKRGATISLNQAIPWTIEIHGGMTKARADLTAMDLRAFQLTGGAVRIRLELGRPSGVVPVRIAGGASELRVERPDDVAVRMRLKGGASRVELDEQRLGAGSDVTLESPGASRAETRYEIEVSGGTNRVTVTHRRRERSAGRI